MGFHFWFYFHVFMTFADTVFFIKDYIVFKQISLFVVYGVSQWFI